MEDARLAAKRTLPQQRGAWRQSLEAFYRQKALRNVAQDLRSSDFSPPIRSSLGVFFDDSEPPSLSLSTLSSGERPLGALLSGIFPQGAIIGPDSPGRFAFCRSKKSHRILKRRPGDKTDLRGPPRHEPKEDMMRREVFRANCPPWLAKPDEKDFLDTGRSVRAQSHDTKGT